MTAYRFLLTRSILGALMMLASPCPFAADVVGTLIQTIITKSPTGGWGSITSPDPSGLAYLDHTGRLLDCDGEVDEMPAFFTGDNLFEVNLDGTLGPTHSTTNLSRSGYSNEPVGCAYNPANRNLFISDDDQRLVFQIRPGPDNQLFTGDDIRTQFRAPNVCGVSDIDAEGLAYGAGKLFIIDGVGAEVWQVTPSADGVFDGVGESCTHFDTSGWATDPEGGEYDTDNPGHLLVVGKPKTRVVSFTTAGTQAGTIDISSTNTYKPAGLATAPGSRGSSDPTPGCKNLYIADRGVDNNTTSTENDGKIYELSIPCSTPGTNQAPTVNAGLDQPAVSFSAACANLSLPTPCINLDGTVTDDGLPNPPGSVSTAWSKISGPGTIHFGNPNAVDTTADFSVEGSYVLRLTADDGALSNSDDVQINILPPPPPLDFTKLYVSTVSDGTTADGVAYANEDILAYDTGTGTWSLYFDGSDVGLGGSVDIDAFSIRPDGSILLSLTTDGVTIPGLGAIDNSDIVRFIPTSIGSTTAGSYEWYFDGSDVELTTSSEDIDAIGFLPDGRLVISTTDSPTVTGVSGAADEDLLVFTPTELGATTSGTWALYFDGSDVELSTSSDEDVNGVFIDNNADIYLTTLGAFSVTGASGSGGDIFTCVPITTGSTTACSYNFTWGGISNGLPSGAVLDGITLVRDSSGNTAPTVTISSPANNASFAEGAPITFTGTATDIQDGGLTASLSWTSSLNGGVPTTIGSGGNFTLTTLPAGIHLITATVTDNAGLSGSASVTISISAPGGSVDTLDVRVSSSSDDAEEHVDGTMESLRSSDLELTLESDNQTVGMRFNGITIPQGATIQNATIQFQVDESSSTTTTLQITGQAADNAATFTNSAGNISSRPTTAGSVAPVSWTPVGWPTVGAAGIDQRTPDIKSVIQAIVSRAGWTSGNSLVVIITGDGNGKRVAESFDGVPAGAPLLHVEYSIGPTLPAVTLSLASLSFGDQIIGSTSAAQTVTLSNSGGSPLTLTNIAASGDFAQTNDCAATLAAAASCTISVTFTPTAAGALSGSVTITDDAADSPQSVGLSGNGVTGPAAALSPTGLSFGDQIIGSTSAAQTVTLSNNGGSTLTLTNIAASGDFAQTNDCAATLAPAASCTISVTFTPTAAGTLSGSVTITDDAADSPQNVSLSGNGVNGPAATLSPTGLSFGDQIIGSTSAAQTVALSNNGGSTLTLTNIAASGDFAQTNDCAATLAPAASCTISVTFTPTAAGALTGSVTVSDNAADSPQSISLSGNGVGPGAALSPTSLSFGDQIIGSTSAAQTVALSNNGGSPLTLTNIAASGDFAQTNDCSTTLAPAASCTISVTFTPTAAGALGGSVTINDDAADSPQSVSLSGNGVTGPAVTLSLASLSFGDQVIGSTSAAQTVTLSNSGGSPLTLTNIAASGDFAQTNDCAATLAPAASCTISVTFTPTAAGALSGSVTITDDAAGSPQSVGLSGNGVNGPAAALSPTGLSFGNQIIGSTSAAQTVTLSNSGSSNLTLTSIAASGDFAQTNDCAATLAPAVSCTISVAFTPTAAGAVSGSVTITDDAADSPQSVSLSGNGVTGPAVALSPTSLSFGDQIIGSTSAAQTVILSNSGGSTLTLTSIAASGDFAQTNDCSATLAPAVSCTISVTFTPTAAGALTGSVMINDDATDSPQSVSLSGNGVTGPAAALSPTSLSFGDQTIGSTSAAQTVILSNSGGSPLTLTSIAASGDFAQTNDCSTTLAPAASCTISVTFTPTAAGALTGSVTITDNAADSPQSVGLSGNGVSAQTELLDVRVSSSSDDAEEHVDGTMESLGSSDLELTLESDNQTVGMRFNGVTIPQGASIQNATIQFQVDESSSTTTTLQITGQAADNAATFANSAGNISSRPTTASSVAPVSWTPVGWPTVGAAGIDQRTPDIKSVIQAIVNRAGWTSGNSLVVIITGDGNGKRVAESFDGVPSAAPLLHIEYSATPPTLPSVTISSPANNSHFTEGAVVNFLATASDPQDGDITASLQWSVDGTSSGVTGGSFSTSTLTAGTHTVIASVTDTDSNPGAASVTVVIDPVPTLPTVSITSPADGAHFTEGATVNFLASASDPQDGDITASLEWSVDGTLSGITGGSFSTSTLTVGTHTVIASVTDNDSNPGTASITVVIDPVGVGPIPDHQWQFDENTGTIAVDSTGTNNATLTNITWVDGKTSTLFDKAVSFNGSNSEGDAGQIDFGTGNFTVVHWVKVTGFKNFAGIFNNRSSASGNIGFHTRTDGTSTLKALIDFGATSRNIAITNAAPGTWYHVAVSVDRAGLMKLYVDGVLADQVDISAFSASSLTNTDNVRLGRDQTSNYFNGVMDDLRIYNSALSEAEILDLYNE